jgi:hypothetical protein
LDAEAKLERGEKVMREWVRTRRKRVGVNVNENDNEDG